MSASELVRNLPGVDVRAVEFVRPCPPRFKCASCGAINGGLRKARCGHTFCPACTQQQDNTTAASRYCPVDGGSLHSDELVGAVDVTEVLQLEVYCPSKRRGCKKTLPLRVVQVHIRSCGYVAVPCPYDCGHQVCRRNLAEHLKEKCERRLVLCEHCQEEVPLKELKEHLEGCGKRPVVCSFCKAPLTKQQMNEHEANCPERPRSCPLANIGCKFKSGPDLIKAHAENVQGHLQLVVNAVLSNQVALQKAVDSMSSLSKQMTQFQEELKHISERMDQDVRKTPKIILNHGDSGRSSPATSDTSRGIKYSAPPTSL